jgi:hypothetical protein
VGEFAGLLPEATADYRMRKCYTKKVYGGSIMAKRAAKMMTERYGETIRSYRCELCGNYHLGHRVPARVRAERN